ncbi:hypothetical protein Vi05172_g399 [Venturia inaequalis]|nr:hypothetical protein Vi05172_g399 [Venturia inaequalis]
MTRTNTSNRASQRKTTDDDLQDLQPFAACRWNGGDYVERTEVYISKSKLPVIILAIIGIADVEYNTMSGTRTQPDWNEKLNLMVCRGEGSTSASDKRIKKTLTWFWCFAGFHENKRQVGYENKRHSQMSRLHIL